MCGEVLIIPSQVYQEPVSREFGAEGEEVKIACRRKRSPKKDGFGVSQCPSRPRGYQDAPREAVYVQVSGMDMKILLGNNDPLVMLTCASCQSSLPVCLMYEVRVILIRVRVRVRGQRAGDCSVQFLDGVYATRTSLLFPVRGRKHPSSEWLAACQ